MADKSDNYDSALDGASRTVATFEIADKSLLMRFQSALHKTPSLVPLIVLVCAIMIFTGWLGPRFLPQMSLVFQQIQVVGILALAQTLVILTAGIDLSVGAIAVLLFGDHGGNSPSATACPRASPWPAGWRSARRSGRFPAGW